MSMPRMVWAELDALGKAIRILKCQKLRVAIDRVAFILKSTAVDDIRRAIWERDGKRCTHCGRALTYQSLEMHERLWRGKGGEVSVENGTSLCGDCHQNDTVAGHGNRRPQWSC